jgi:cyclic-di-GMP phosphodiesterase TipF (flagellum assembly factor)
LLGAAETPHSDIHIADLSSLLGRFGITLIAEHIETEAQVVELLDYGIRFGQGFLFSTPRPIRLESLRDANETVSRPEREAPEVRRKLAAGGLGRAL